MSLCLHAGAQAIDRIALAALPVPAPLGPRHAIRPFIADVELIDTYLGRNGYIISDEAFGVRNDKNDVPADFFGVLTVAPAREGEYIPAGTADFSLQIGIRGSYAQTMSRAICVGNRVFCCDNMAFSSEIVVGTKQTLNVANRLPQLLADAVARIPAFAQHQIDRFDAYKNKRVADRAGDALLVECVRRAILNPSQIGKAIEYWDAPEHPEHLERGQRTAYTLYNAVTEALKQPSGKSNILPLWERTIPLTALFDEGVGLDTFH
jgi:hypothetical protein